VRRQCVPETTIFRANLRHDGPAKLERQRSEIGQLPNAMLRYQQDKLRDVFTTYSYFPAKLGDRAPTSCSGVMGRNIKSCCHALLQLALFKLGSGSSAK
jgi:hypothetical protein